MHPSRPVWPGFTLIELLVVIAIIAILAGLLVPALSHGKSGVQGLKCRNDLKQLPLAWQMYADDHEGRIVPNGPWEWGAPECYWGCGKMRCGLDNTDNTNTLFLTGGYLGPYHRSAEIFKDSADRSVADLGGRPDPRVRTVSMNMWSSVRNTSWANGSWPVLSVSLLVALVFAPAQAALTGRL